MKSHGESSAYIRRNSGTKSVGASSSFSGLRGKLCGCGEKVVLLQANTTKNKGRFFWRCRNWRVSSFNSVFVREIIYDWFC